MFLLDKKEFHASKPAIALNLVEIETIVISEKFKCNGKFSKYIIRYRDNDIIKTLCIVLSQTSV